MSQTASGFPRKQKWYNKNIFPLVPVIEVRKKDEHNTTHFSFRWLVFTFWYGKIIKIGEQIENYNTKESGAFNYLVKEGLTFKVKKGDDIYCTGIIIKLPDNFVSHKK